MERKLRALSAAMVLALLCGIPMEGSAPRRAACAEGEAEGADSAAFEFEARIAQSDELPAPEADAPAVDPEPAAAEEIGGEGHDLEEIDGADVAEPIEGISPDADIETDVAVESAPEPSPGDGAGEADAPSDAPSAGGIEFANGDVVLGAGQTLDSALRPALTGDAVGMEAAIRYASSDLKVVRVDAISGSLTGVKAGSAAVTASLELPGGALSASCTITVLPAPRKISIQLESNVLGAGERVSPNVVAPSQPDFAFPYTLSSNRPGIVAVEGNSIVAVAPGAATVTARSYNGKSARVKITVKPAPSSVAFASSGAPMGVGMERELAARVNSGAAGGITFTLAQGGEFAALEGNVLKAIAPGEVVVRAETYSGLFAEQAIAICPAPVRASLLEKDLLLGLKETRADALHLVLDEGSAASAVLRSSDERIVKVDPNTGALTGLRKGTALVYAATYNGVECPSPCAVTVTNAPRKIMLSVPVTLLFAGQTVEAAVSLPEGTAGSWTLQSSDPSVIEVRDGAILAAIGPGTAKVKAVCYNSRSCTVEITVFAAPYAIEPAREEYLLYQGQTGKVAFRTPGSRVGLEYRSSDPDTVRVDAEGNITGLRLGEARVTASTYNGLEASVPVCVCPVPDSLSAAQSEVTICVGERLPFPFATVPERAAADYLYASSDVKIASVDANGDICGQGVGMAVIDACSHNGLSARITVNVVPYSSAHEVSVVGHQGAAGLCEGNTLASFATAVALGADRIGSDMRMTADGQIVLSHNSKLNGLRISLSTLAELRAVNPNLATLEEALDYVSQQPMIGMNLEFKDFGPEIEEKAVALLRKYHMEHRVSLNSFDINCTLRIKAMDPSIEVLFPVKYKSILKKILANPQDYSFASTIAVKYNLLSTETVRDLHLLGFKVGIWTVNNKKFIAKRLPALGVDSVTTDYPDRI